MYQEVEIAFIKRFKANHYAKERKKEKKKCKQKEKFSKVLCAKKFKQAGELENNQYQNNCKFREFFRRNSSKFTHLNKN